MAMTDERSARPDVDPSKDGRPTPDTTADRTGGYGVVPTPPMPTGRVGDRGFWLILGAVLVAAVLVAVLVAIPDSRPAPAGTVPPDSPLARIIGDIQGMLAPGSQSLLVVLTKLVLAALLGGILGYRQRPAIEDYIVQAHVIIAFTGALMMIIIGNQIVVAVGLLSAGSIIRYRTPVSNPKALATLFVALGVGIAVGLGLYELALIAAVLVVGLQGLANTIAGVLPRTLYNPQRGYVMKLTTQDGAGTIAWLKETFAARGIRSRLREYDAREGKDNLVKITMSLEAAASMTTEQLTLLVLADGVQSVSLEEKAA